MDFEHGFTLWRELGKTGSGEYLPFAALVAIHWVHRSFAWIVIAVVAVLGWRARRIKGLQRLGRFLLAALALQFVTGMATIFLKWPLALAVIHNGGAALLVAILTMLNFHVRFPARTAVEHRPARFSPA